MKILISLPSYHPGYGGPFFSGGALAKALATKGHRVTLLTAGFPNLPAQDPPEGVEIVVLPGRRIPGIGQSWMPGVRKRLDDVFDRIRPDVVHDNGVWLSLNLHVARVAHARGIPLMLSPRGCLDPWAMRYRGWKKRLALALYQRRALEKVTCFHAASELEAESIRKLGLGQSIAVIPNGIELPKVEREKRKVKNGEENLNSQLPTPNFQLPAAERHALFMGRLHPIKNLPTLLRAWAEVRPEGWILKLAGSDEEGHQAELEALAKELGIADQVEFLGPRYGTGKEELFRASELVFLVSHSENFGIAVAEALAYGIPVIASKTTPWSCLESEKIGWWVEGTPEGIAGALREAVLCSDTERSEMGARGRRYVEENFSWDAVSEEFLGVYCEFMLSGWVVE